MRRFVWICISSFLLAVLMLSACNARDVTLTPCWSGGYSYSYSSEGDPPVVTRNEGIFYDSNISSIHIDESSFSSPIGPFFSYSNKTSLLIYDISFLGGSSLNPGSATMSFTASSAFISGWMLDGLNGDMGVSRTLESYKAVQERARIASGQSGSFSIDVTPYLQACINAGYPRATFELSEGVASKYENGTYIYNPSLVVRVVPEPSGFLALIACVGAMGGSLLRRKLR